MNEKHVSFVNLSKDHDDELSHFFLGDGSFEDLNALLGRLRLSCILVHLIPLILTLMQSHQVFFGPFYFIEAIMELVIEPLLAIAVLAFGWSSQERGRVFKVFDPIQSLIGVFLVLILGLHVKADAVLNVCHDFIDLSLEHLLLLLGIKVQPDLPSFVLVNLDLLLSEELDARFIVLILDDLHEVRTRVSLAKCQILQLRVLQNLEVVA